MAKRKDLNGILTVVDMVGARARPFQEGEGIPVYAKDFQLNMRNSSQKSIKRKRGTKLLRPLLYYKLNTP